MYHINSKGEPGSCRAKPGNCPFAGEEEHYGSPEEAREAYEQRMEISSSKRKIGKELPRDLLVSVMDSKAGILTERDSAELGEVLEPGTYAASFYDEASGKDSLVKIVVKGPGDVTHSPISAFQSYINVSSPETQAAAANLRDNLNSLVERCEPAYCHREKINRVTLIEAVSGIRRVLAKHDWANAEEAYQGRQELEDVEWALDEDLKKARALMAYKDDERALTESKRIITEFFD